MKDNQGDKSNNWPQKKRKRFREQEGFKNSSEFNWRDLRECCNYKVSLGYGVDRAIRNKKEILGIKSMMDKIKSAMK